MRRKRYFLTLVLCFILASIPIQASGSYKTKRIYYTNPIFYYNGIPKALSSQPIVIDGLTYLPVRPLCNALGMDVSWNGSIISVTNQGEYGNTYSHQAEILAKDAQIAALNNEIIKLKNQLGVTTSTTTSTSGSTSYTQTSGNDIIGTELTATRIALDNSYSDYFNDIDFEFWVSHAYNTLRVTLTYDTSYENREFNDLASYKVRDFVEEICETIRLRHDDIVISGAIKYGSSTKYSFRYSKGDTLSTSYDDDYYGYYNDLTESDVMHIVERADYVYSEGYSSKLYIKDVDANVDDRNDIITFKIYLDLTDSDIKEAWNAYTDYDENDDLRESMDSIADDIADETNYEIRGYIYDDDTGKKVGEYDYYDNKIDTITIS